MTWILAMIILFNIIENVRIIMLLKDDQIDLISKSLFQYKQNQFVSW